MAHSRPPFSGFISRVALLAVLLFSWIQPAAAQVDVIPSSVDIRLVQGSTAEQLLVQVKSNSTGSFGGIFSALTVTIRYDATSGAALGAGTSFCNAWSSFPPSPVVTDNGSAYRTYNGFGINRLADPVFDGGCNVSIPANQWFTITTIPVSGGTCTNFTLGNDAYTGAENRDYYISMAGVDVTGQVVGGPVLGGSCLPDCLGIVGGTALPGSACDDSDPNTSNDTWSANCECLGTVTCTAPTVSTSTSNSPICSGSTLSLAVTATGTGPLSYAWTGTGTFSPNASSQNVTVTGAASGNYQVVVTNACGTASSTVAVVVNPAPSATISYSGSPYCASTGSATVTRTGTANGTYTAAPSGLSINASTGAINLGSSTAGSYTVTYSIAASGGCAAFTTTAPVVINTAPSATISYSGSPYCASTGSATVTRTGTANGTYTATPSGLSLNTSTGVITLGTSSAGSYTVTYSIAASGGCAAFSTTAAVVIGTAPSATISYGGSPYCGTGSVDVTRTGTANGTYTATPSGLSLNGSTGAINLSTSTAGSYTVTYSIAASGGCAAFSTTAPVVIGTAPSATISYDGSPYCGTGTASVTRTGTANGTYSATPSGLSINASTGALTLGTSTAGSYTVTYSIAASGGCAAFSTTAPVVISTAPSAAISYDGSPYCGTGTASVTRTGTANGSFSATPTGLSINASTGAITLGTSTAGSYIVTYSIAASGGCAAFSTTASVVISTAPSAAISYSGSPYCASTGSATVTRTGTANGTYTASPSGLSLNASTGAINLGTSTAGNYTVTYSIAASGGCAAFSTTAAVVIGTAPSATISYEGSPYCGTGTASVTRTGTANGSYSATPTGLSINASTGAITLGTSTAGSYTVTYSIAASGGCAAFSTTAAVVLSTAPSAAISYSGSPYCASTGTANVTRTGTANGTYSATPAGLTINASTGAITLGTSTAGSYTVTYSIAASGGCAAFSTTAPVVLSTAPSAAISYSGSPYCASTGTANVTRTGTSNGSYSATPAGLSINASTGEINLGTSAAGNYTVTYGIAASGGCAAINAAASVVISAAPSATISYVGSPYCASTGTASVTRTGTANGTYSATPSGLTINASTGAITLGTSTAGSYTVTYSIAASGGCAAFSTTTSVVISNAPSAAISYAGSPYCASTGTANVTRTGTANGSYSATPAGLSINASTGAIALGTSTAGSYTVTYSIAATGGCAAFSTTASVVISTATSAVISYAGSPYCASTGTANVTVTGTTNGSYSATPAGLSINASTGAINLGTSTAGSYTVTYSIAASGGCAAFSTTAPVVISTTPTASISYAGSPYCGSTGTANVTRTGTANGSYSATPVGLSINASTGAINIGTSTAGSYTVTYSIAASGGCAAFNATASVVISTAPSATISYVGSPYCNSTGTANVTITGTANGSYSATPAGLSINASTGVITLGTSTAGSYTVTYSIAAAGGCAAFSTTASVVVNAAPSAAISYADAPYCTSGGTALVTRTGNSGGTYSALPSGLSIDPNSGTINLGTSASATYTVTYTIGAAGGCASVSTTTTIEVGPAPVATINYAGSPYCASGGSATVTRTGSGGGTYSASPAGLVINSTTGAVNLGTSAAGDYTVTYSVAAAGGCAAYSTTTQIAVGASPSATILYGGSPYCASSGDAEVIRTGTDGGTYSAIPAGLLIDATTGTVDLSASSAGEYTVTYAVAASGGCSAFSTTTTISIGVAPSATINYGGSPYCATSGVANVTRTGTPGGVFTATPPGLSLDPASGAIDLGSSSAGAYFISYDIAAGGGCTAFNTSIEVVVNQVPSATIAYTGSPYCSDGGSVSVLQTGTSGGTYSAIPAGLSLDLNNGEITLATSIAGTYTVNYSIAAASGCAAFMANASIVISEAPVATISYDGSPYCTGGGTANVSITGTVGGTFAAAPGGLSISANTGEIDLASSTAGTYLVTYSISAGGGCSAFSTTSQVVVGTAPSATIEYGGTPYCSVDGVASVSRSGSGGGVYSATPAGLSLDPVTGSITLATTTPGTYTVSYSIAASGGCDAFATAAEVVIDQATVWYADLDGDGAGDPLDSFFACVQPAGYVAVAGDDCPNDQAKTDPGVCGCGTPDTDTDGDGIADCIDNCPLLPGVTGDACDDGDPNTMNDVITANCECVGAVDFDCPGLQANIGDSCDDGDANTQNDVITADCECVGTVVYDCPGLQANIGDSCDDGDANTQNDVVTANCECVGTVVYDCPGLQANIGDACDDGDANTENDVVTANCECVGTVVYDCPGLQANIGDTCDDGDANTQNDVVTANCECAGTVVYDCPGLQANIGDSCDDGDANTQNEVITANCECVGTVVYDCPGLQANIGDSCDDGDANTENDVITTNCECVGTVVYDCPGLQANIGDACDDGDANTENDVITANCECAGTVVYDCPGLQANIGDACDDGDSNTENDVVTANCECAGTVVYDCPGLQANIGDACDDGDSNTENDVVTANCECVGTVIYDCPGLQANIGDACDDGNSNTENDVVTANCECVGTVVYDCPGIQANIGDACDDGDANTENDVITADCECLGTVICVPPTIGDITSNSPICSSSVLTLGATASGSGPLTYAWTGSGTFAPSANVANVTVANAASGTYQVSVSNGCGTVTGNIVVVVDVAPNASISYAGTPYCELEGVAAVSLNGTAAGTFTALPSGLVINAATGLVDLVASDAGTYIVTYSIAASGECSGFSVTTGIGVASATVWYADVDGDGVGDENNSLTSCSQPAGYVAISGDDCPNDPDKLEPGACGCGISDVDTDGDGTADCIDGCPTDPNKVAPGACGCGIPDTDSDGDGTADCIDGCPTDPNKVAPGACGCGVPDTDTDGDGIPDCIDNCPALPGQIGDVCDDGDPNTENDLITANCECVGTMVYDCADIQANFGDACDDGNPDTENDEITDACECVGTTIYDCADIQANFGDACDDSNAATHDDVITEECLCVGELTIGIQDVDGRTGVTLALFPNPNRTGLVTLHIEGLAMDRSQALIVIHDASGRRVYEREAPVVAGVLSQGMDLSGRVSQGLYMVEVIAGSERYLQRLIIQ